MHTPNLARHPSRALGGSENTQLVCRRVHHVPTLATGSTTAEGANGVHGAQPLVAPAAERTLPATAADKGSSDERTRTLVLRHVAAPTRMLHPAADCYRALGYRIAQARLEQDAQQRLWRCFAAQRPGAAPLRVCERIVDAEGRAFTDTSAWYWAAATGRSTGPWQAVTVAQVGGAP